MRGRKKIVIISRCCCLRRCWSSLFAALERQLQYWKTVTWLVEWAKIIIIVVHVRQTLWCIWGDWCKFITLLFQWMSTKSKPTSWSFPTRKSHLALNLRQQTGRRSSRREMSLLTKECCLTRSKLVRVLTEANCGECSQSWLDHRCL